MPELKFTIQAGQRFTFRGETFTIVEVNVRLNAIVKTGGASVRIRYEYDTEPGQIGSISLDSFNRFYIEGELIKEN